MEIRYKELRSQIARDQAFVERLSGNVKNALAGEIKSFWPKALTMKPPSDSSKNPPVGK